MSRQESQCSPPYARSSTTPGSIGSASASSIVRRKNARDIFDEYGIARPENWLSEENSESGGARPRPQPQLPASITSTKLEYRRCHSCRRHLPTGKECPDCGHESCIECTDEMPLGSFSLIDTTTQPRPLSGRHHEAVGRDVSKTSLPEQVDSIESVQRSRVSHTKSLTPKPLASGSRKLPVAKQNAIVEERDTSRRVVSDTLKNNPFVQADSIQKGLALEPQIHPHNVVARRPTELSDCLPQTHMNRSASDSTAPGECDDRSCRQQEGGIRHSVGCTSRRKALQQLASREWNADRYVHERLRQNQHTPLQDPLQRKIDQLYHHSDDLYRSQHIIEHLAAGTRTLAESLERESPNFSERDHGSIASVQSDSRLHSLGADVMEEIEQLVQDHSLHQDSKFGEQQTSPSLHSLHADERTDEPDSISAHSLQDDPTMQRELSPLSLGNRGEINKFGFTALPLQPTQRLNTLKSLSPRSMLDQVTSFPKPRTRNTLGISKSSSDLKSAQAVTPNDRGVVSGTVKARKSVIEDRNRSQARISVSQKRKPHQPRPSNNEPVAETWPQLKPVGKVTAEESWHVADTSAPWPRHALREVQAHQEHSPHRHDTPNLFSLRQQLRKVEAPESPKAVKPPTPPLSQLRRSPGRLIATPPTKDINCGNCNPSDTPSSVQEGSDTGVVAEQHELNSHALAEHTATHPQVGDARGEWREILQSPSRMRLRDLENTLARHSAEDLQSLQGGKTSTKRKEASLATPLDLLPMSGGGDPHIHNPRPFLPPDHACEWRARCMDLNSEVEQLKSEMSEMESNHTFEQRSEPLVRGYISVGVGDTMAQHECHEFGIEGLTIVLHMRGKDDLVINTDLAKETPPI